MSLNKYTPVIFGHVIFYLVFLFSGFNLSAQDKDNDIYTPADVLRDMDSSKEMYLIDILEDKIPCTDRSKKLNKMGMVRVKRDSFYTWELYDISDQAAKEFIAAEKSFEAGNLKKAREQYANVSKIHPDFSTPLTYIGQTYEREKDYKKAISYYKKAIDVNYYDFMAHWFLADNLVESGKKNEALKEITIASILNRNNTRIAKSLQGICRETGKKYEDWCFEPQIVLYKTDTGTIYVSGSETWLIYAMAKALWKYEPGYRASMGDSTGSIYSFEQEKECVKMLYIALMSDEQKKWDVELPLKTLVKAVDNKAFYEYLVYEVMLPKFPQIAFQFSKDYIETLSDYILNVHCRY